jgi:hypothetical protein
MDGLYMLLLGCLVFFSFGAALERTSSFAMGDFKAVYYGARCLIQHHDPYQESEFLSVYLSEGGAFPSNPILSRSLRQAIPVCINLPTALFAVTPLAILPSGLAEVLWMFLTAGSFILASILMWSLGARYAPRISGGLVFLLLANSELLLFVGNTAGVAVSLCVVAAWCFLEERFVPAGILLLAISLALKPHDAGLVWLYFLLAGGVYRKRALQTLAVAAALILPAVLWVSHVAPHWMQELQSNLLATSAHGGLNDPGPASMGSHGIGMVICLQAVISVFWDNARIYNPASYLVCGAMLLVWLRVTLRSRFSLARAWFALAAIAPLTMLPVYHRSYDARLLLLTVPACVMLWAEGGVVRWLALLVNTAGILLTGDIAWAIFYGLIGKLHLSNSGLSGQILTVVQVFPAPLILLAMAVFYLWIYAHRAPAKSQPGI